MVKDNYDIIHLNSKRAHEFIINVNSFEKYNIKCKDIAKRLIDYGFHSPTMSWPINNCLMIEITETEPIEEIDRFINAMNNIADEIREIDINDKENLENNILKNAPHTQRDLLDWNYPYSIEKGCFPAGTKNKYWPTINRVNDSYGDRHFKLENTYKNNNSIDDFLSNITI